MKQYHTVIYRSKDWLYQKYVVEGLSQNKIGKICGVGPIVICKWMRRLGIKARPTDFFTGPNTECWKGGRTIHRGYYEIMEKEHPKADSSGYVYEHRSVMEKRLGRRLLRSEVVHHIDFNKLNNNIDNLLLMGRGEHGNYHVRMKHLFEHWLGA